jgi:hypothetical protein
MSSENRSACRIPVPPGQEQGLLIWRGARQSVQIVNRSATGYLVECPAIEVDEGMVLKLVSASGTCEVRVRHVRTGETEGRFRLGLELVQEVLEDEGPRTSVLHLLLPPRYARSTGGAGVSAMACFVVATIVGSAIALSNHDPTHRAGSSWKLDRLLPSFRPSGRQGFAHEQAAHLQNQAAHAARELTNSRWLAAHWTRGDREWIAQRLALTAVQRQQLELLVSGGRVDQQEIDRQLTLILTPAQNELLVALSTK